MAKPPIFEKVDRLFLSNSFNTKTANWISSISSSLAIYLVLRNNQCLYLGFWALQRILARPISPKTSPKYYPSLYSYPLSSKTTIRFLPSGYQFLLHVALKFFQFGSLDWKADWLKWPYLIKELFFSRKLNNNSSKATCCISSIKDLNESFIYVEKSHEFIGSSLFWIFFKKMLLLVIFIDFQIDFSRKVGAGFPLSRSP